MDDDGTVDLEEFKLAITPKSSEFKGAGQASSASLSVEQRRVFEQAQMETLAALFDAIISSDAEIEEKREQLQLDGESLFDVIDTYKMGYLSTHALG